MRTEIVVIFLVASRIPTIEGNVYCIQFICITKRPSFRNREIIIVNDIIIVYENAVSRTHEGRIFLYLIYSTRRIEVGRELATFQDLDFLYSRRSFKAAKRIRPTKAQRICRARPYVKEQFARITIKTVIVIKSADFHPVNQNIIIEIDLLKNRFICNILGIQTVIVRFIEIESKETVKTVSFAASTVNLLDARFYNIIIVGRNRSLTDVFTEKPYRIRFKDNVIGETEVIIIRFIKEILRNANFRYIRCRQIAVGDIDIDRIASQTSTMVHQFDENGRINCSTIVYVVCNFAAKGPL